MENNTLPVGHRSIPEEVAPSTAVVAAIAELQGISPLDLKPLSTVIDTDALDRIVTSTATGTAEPSTLVSFPYSGYRVTVTGGQGFAIESLEAAAR